MIILTQMGHFTGNQPLAVLQFPFLLKRDSSISLVMWNVRIPGRTTIELSVHHLDHQLLESSQVKFIDNFVAKVAG